MGWWAGGLVGPVGPGGTWAPGRACGPGGLKKRKNGFAAVFPQFLFSLLIRFFPSAIHLSD